MATKPAMPKGGCNLFSMASPFIALYQFSLLICLKLQINQAYRWSFLLKLGERPVLCSLLWQSPISRGGHFY